MKQLLTVACVLSLALLVASSSFADIKANPKHGTKIISEKTAPAPKTPSENKSLEKIISYTASEKQVNDILKDLSKLSGVKLRIGHGGSDWHAGERKINVFAKDVRIIKLMESIARVTESKWAKSADNIVPPIYRLVTDEKRIKELEDLKAKEVEETKKHRSNILEKYKKLGDMSESDLQNIKSNDALGYAMGITGMAKVFGVISSLPGAADALRNGDPLTIHGSQLSPTQWEALMGGFKKVEQFNYLSGDSKPEQSKNISPADFEININQGYRDGSSRADEPFILGMVDFNGGGVSGMVGEGIPLFDPENPFSKFIGKVIGKALDQNTSMNTLMESNELQADAAELENLDLSFQDVGDLDEPETDHSKDPSDPELSKKVEIDSKNHSDAVLDYESDISGSTGVAIVSDAWDKYSISPNSISSGKELKEVVSTLSRGKFNWEKHGSIVEFRDRRWYTKMNAMVPQVLLDKWRNTLIKTGYLDLPDLVQILDLTYLQFKRNVLMDKVFTSSRIEEVWSNNGEMIKFYGSLDDRQRSALFSKEGLDTNFLSDKQRKFFDKAANSGGNEFTAEEGITYILSAFREERFVNPETHLDEPGPQPGQQPVPVKPSEPIDSGSKDRIKEIYYVFTLGIANKGEAGGEWDIRIPRRSAITSDEDQPAHSEAGPDK